VLLLEKLHLELKLVTFVLVLHGLGVLMLDISRSVVHIRDIDDLRLLLHIYRLRRRRSLEMMMVMVTHVCVMLFIVRRAVLRRIYLMNRRWWSVCMNRGLRRWGRRRWCRCRVVSIWVRHLLWPRV